MIHNILWTAVVAVLIYAAKLLTPWVKAQTAEARQRALDVLADTLVEAAEQVYGQGNGKTKLEEVTRWLTERGFPADRPSIEAAVLRLKNNYYIEEETCYE